LASSGPKARYSAGQPTTYDTAWLATAPSSAAASPATPKPALAAREPAEPDPEPAEAAGPSRCVTCTKYEPGIEAGSAASYRPGAVWRTATVCVSRWAGSPPPRSGRHC